MKKSTNRPHWGPLSRVSTLWLVLGLMGTTIALAGSPAAGSPAAGAPAAGSPTIEKATMIEPPPLQVSHVGADSVYLSGGRSHGLEVGQTVTIYRDGEPIAELEVAFVSRNSASCRLVESRLEILLGDEAVPVATLETDDEAPPRNTAELPTSEEPQPRKADRKRRSSPKISSSKWADLSGTLSLRWHHFEDGSDVPRSFDQTTTRLNLRTQGHGGAYEARIRVRGREDRRYSESEPTETSRRDRLYELALSYDPPEGQLFFELGRMPSSPLLGFESLDGVLGEYKVKPHFGFGGFYGQRSNLDDLGFGSQGAAYGVFFHYQRKRSRDSPFYAEVSLGGIRESYEGEVSRDYLSLYARLGSGSHWSFYQRADVDINTDWRREVAGDDYQVSNLLTSANYRFSDRFRVGLSYDHRRRFREFENRDTPEEIFDDRLREGLRLSFQIGDPRSWRFNTSFGIRRAEATAEDSYTATGSIFHTNIGGKNILLGLDFSSFSGETSEGYRVSLRGRKYFSRGHDLGLTIGSSTTTSRLAGLSVDSVNQWVRLNGTIRLPKRFFVLAEVEVTEGDDLAGERFILQLGYRL